MGTSGRGTKKTFEWQSGYLSLTVSPSQIEAVSRYVLNQEKNHRRKTFQEEYLELIKLSGIEFDTRHLW